MANLIKKKFIGNNEVDGAKILLEQGQSIRIKDSTGTEVELVKLGASDEVIVNGSEVSLKSDLDQEIIDRAAGDAATQATAAAYTDGQISSFETVVTSQITAGDSATLTSANSYTDQEVLAEENARIAADSSLQSQIDSITGGGSGSLSAVQAELDATQLGAGLEIDGSYLADPLTFYIPTASSLKNADFILDATIKIARDEIATEVTSRFDGDAALQLQIDNLLSNVDPAALDSLTEIVDAFQSADATLNGAITSLSTGLSADIAAEESARIAADSVLQGEIDAEEIARAAADVTLQNNIDAEQSARIAADSALDVRVGVLEAVVWVKEKFSIVNGQTSVTLGFTPKANSMTAFVDRLAIHEGASDDFTISGTTMTFLNDLVSPGQSQIGNGDTVYVKYQK